MLEKSPSSTELSEKPLDSRSPTDVGGLDLDNLVPGAHWRGRYLIHEVLPDITHGKTVSASEIETSKEVTIRSFRVNDDLRQRAWWNLTKFSGKGITPLIESAEADGRRIEVVGAPRGISLASWSNGRKIGLAEIKPLVQQIATVVSGLHGLGVVHLNLSLQTVFIEETTDGPQIVLSGLETATDISRSSLVSINVNPFYAPPDAVGLYQHHCGPTLRPWDWWSVGRMVQEMVLGAHVLGILLERDVTRHTPELLMRADQFLREHDAERPRAGGVEVMPAMDSSLNVLLRGLLSSSRDARWGAREVEAWIRGEAVKDRYYVPRNERLFPWKDQVYTLVEAAQIFSSAELWSEGVKQLYDQKNPKSLICFLGDDVSSRKVNDRVVDLLKLADTAAYSSLPVDTTREVIAGIAFAFLGNGQVPIRWRGQTVDTNWLHDRLKPEAQPEGLTQVQAMTEESSIKQIALVDAAAGRVLGDFAHLVQSALLLAQTHHWISFSDPLSVAALFRKALANEAAHLESLSGSRELYAATRDDLLQALFSRGALNETEIIVVNWTLERPDVFHYITHEIWGQELYSKLRDEGLRVSKAESWFTLGMRIRVGAHVLGPWPVFMLIWLAASASVALAYPNRLTLGLALALLGLGFALRVISKKLIQKELRHHDLMWDGILKFSGANCEKNGARCVPALSPVSKKILHAKWLEINGQIQKLRGKSAFLPIPPGAKFSFFKNASVVSTVAFLAVGATLGWHVIKNPPTIPILKAAWFFPEERIEKRSGKTVTTSSLDSHGEAVAASKDLAADSDGGPTFEESKAKKKKIDDRGIVREMSWAFKKTDDAQHVTIVDELPATPEQTAAALEAGQAAAKPYRASTISGLIAVQVPMDEGIGLMLYDGQAGKVTDKHVFRIGYVPLAKSWVQLDDHRAIYLGQN